MSATWGAIQSAFTLFTAAIAMAAAERLSGLLRAFGPPAASRLRRRLTELRDRRW